MKPIGDYVDQPYSPQAHLTEEVAHASDKDLELDLSSVEIIRVDSHDDVAESCSDNWLLSSKT